MSKFSFCKLIAWILIVFHCGLFSVVLVITEYQYRKRQAVTSNSTNEESNQTIDEDEAAVTAMSIHRSLKFAMTKNQRRGRWILIVFHCGLFSVVLVIGKCKFISTIHIYFYLYDYTKANIYNFVFKSSNYTHSIKRTMKSNKVTS
jgi:hypothetical protein